jgi:putative oxidoreductase
MKNLISTRVAIIIFAVIIGIFGANNILHAKAMSSDIPPFLPLPMVLIYISGVAYLLAAVAFILDRYARPAGYILFLFLLIKVFTVDVIQITHAANMGLKVIFIKSILKDAALAMAAVVIADISGLAPQIRRMESAKR